MESFADPFTEAELRQRVASEVALFQEMRPAAVVMGFTLSVAIWWTSTKRRGFSQPDIQLPAVHGLTRPSLAGVGHQATAQPPGAATVHEMAARVQSVAIGLMEPTASAP